MAIPKQTDAEDRAAPFVCTDENGVRHPIPIPLERLRALVLRSLTDEELQNELAMREAGRVMPSYQDLAAMAAAKPLVDDPSQEW